MKTLPKLKASYDDHMPASNETGLKCLDKSLTQQHQAEETDINFIVKRFIQTGELNQHTRPPMTGDFTEAPDMQTAMDLVVQARVAFMEQPAEIRSRFNNDPVAFVDFCSNEGNRDEMRKMGLWSPEAAARFDAEAKARAQEALDNKRDADELRASRKETPKKGVT